MKTIRITNQEERELFKLLSAQCTSKPLASLLEKLHYPETLYVFNEEEFKQLLYEANVIQIHAGGQNQVINHNVLVTVGGMIDRLKDKQNKVAPPPQRG